MQPAANHIKIGCILIVLAEQNRTEHIIYLT